MYKKYLIKTPFKTVFEDVFSGARIQKSFTVGEQIEGRIDYLNGKSYLVTSDGLGSIVNSDFLIEKKD